MPNYQFIYNPMYDYLMSIVHLVNPSSMDDEAAAIGIVFDQDLAAWQRSMEKKLPRSTLSEARFFFFKGLMPGLVALDVVRRENTRDLATLIARIEAMSPRRFLLGMLENALCDPDPATGAAYTEESVPTTLDGIRDKITCRCGMDDEYFDLFLDACMNPADSQERLVRLLRKYEEPYRENGACFEARSLEAHRRLSETWGNNPEQFLTGVICLQPDFFAADQTVYLAPSFFLDIGFITFIYSGEFGVHDSYVVYGTGIEQRTWLKAGKDRRKSLFKTLAEDNRFEILKRLARRDYYLLELARELGLTSATASHHLSMLFELDVVDMQREGNKVFYRLKREPLVNLFKEALQEIIQQDVLP